MTEISEATILKFGLVAIILSIAISPISAFAESTVQNSFDDFFGGIGSAIKGFVGDDFNEDQTDKINETIDSGTDAGSIAVQMFLVFHHFIVSAMLMIASLFGVVIGETIAYVIGVVITLIIVGTLLYRFVINSWKIVLAILGILALLMFLGVIFIDA